MAVTEGNGVRWAPYWHPERPWLMWTGADHGDGTTRPNYDVWIARYRADDDGIRFGAATRDGDVLANYLATRGDGFGAEVKRRIMLGTYALSAGYYEAYYGQAQKVRTLIIRDYEEAFARFDVLVSPTSPTTAFRIGERAGDPLAMYLSDVFTIPANLAGVPAISVPCGFDAAGLPACVCSSVTGTRNSVERKLPCRKSGFSASAFMLFLNSGVLV